MEGVDHDYSQVQISRKNTEGLPNVRVRYCASECLPYSLHGKFDLTLCSFGILGNQGDGKFSFLKNMVGSLKYGGRCFFSVYAENAVGHQSALYRHLGMETKVVGDHTIAIKEDGQSWVSERFTKQKLCDLFSDNDATNYKIEKFSGFTYMCEVAKATK